MAGVCRKMTSQCGVRLISVTVLFDYDVIVKVLFFAFSFQNLGIRCVKKKEVKEAIILRISAGINPFNGKCFVIISTVRISWTVICMYMTVPLVGLYLRVPRALPCCLF